jgi:NADH-quinone oxidoreductase subunit M
MTLAAPWLAGLLGFPLITALLCSFDDKTDRVRAVGIACAAASCALGLLVYVVGDLQSLDVPWPGQQPTVLGASMLRVSPLSLPLIGLPSALWLVTIAATPGARLDIGGLRRTALATTFGTLAFLTENPVLLACCWIASSILFLKGLSSAEAQRTRRVVKVYQLLGAILLVAGIIVAATAEASTAGLWLISAAVLVRKGIFPFHAWIPEAFDRGRIGPTVLFSAPQLGTFVAATLVVPHATPEMLRVVAILSLVTALYGAALALFQPDARRALGYLFVSQSALVLAGLDCTSVDALTGALILWLSSAFAFTGLARTVLALEARRGRLKLTRYHGGFEQMPLLAASFLVFGLACTGFPGTLGFIGQEMLVAGAVRSFPAVGFLTICASALTGLAVLRMYFSLFCGAPGGVPVLGLRLREGLAFGTIAVLLVVSGLAPRAIVASREHASQAIVEQRSVVERGE